MPVECVVLEPRGSGRRLGGSFDDTPIGRHGSSGGSGSAAPKAAGPPQARPMKKLTVAENFYREAQRDSSHQALSKQKHSSGSGRSRPPAFLVCYLCGQQFGKTSLPIHQPQCYVKRLVQWERGDPATRGAKPMHPDDAAEQLKGMASDGSGVTNAATADAFNAAQFQSFQQQMVACDNCGRTFYPERLAVHKRSCRPDAPGRGSKPVRAGRGRANSPDGPDVMPPASSRPAPRAPSPQRAASRAQTSPHCRPASPDRDRMQVRNRSPPPRAGGGGLPTPQFAPQHRSPSEAVSASPRSASTEPAHHAPSPDASKWDAEIAAAALCDSPPAASPAPEPVRRPSPARSAGTRPEDPLPLPREAPPEAVSQWSGSDAALALALAREEEMRADEIAAAPAPSPPRSRHVDPAQARRSPLRVPSPARRHQPPAAPPQLEPCPNCGRRFRPQKLATHRAVCKGPSPSVTHSVSGLPSAGAGPTAHLVACRYCSRTFAHDRIERHEECCVERKAAAMIQPPKAQKALKKPGLQPSPASSRPASPNRRAAPAVRAPRTSGAPASSSNNYAEVANWLSTLALSTPVTPQTLEREGIDGEAINCSRGDVEGLCTAIGVTRYGDRQKLKRALGSQ